MLLKGAVLCCTRWSVLNFKSVDETLVCITIEMKATEQCTVHYAVPGGSNLSCFDLWMK